MAKSDCECECDQMKCMKLEKVEIFQFDPKTKRMAKLKKSNTSKSGRCKLKG